MGCVSNHGQHPLNAAFEDCLHQSVTTRLSLSEGSFKCSPLSPCNEGSSGRILYGPTGGSFTAQGILKLAATKAGIAAVVLKCHCPACFSICLLISWSRCGRESWKTSRTGFGPLKSQDEFLCLCWPLWVSHSLYDIMWALHLVNLETPRDKDCEHHLVHPVYIKHFTESRKINTKHLEQEICNVFYAKVKDHSPYVMTLMLQPHSSSLMWHILLTPCLNDACKKSHGPYFRAGRQTAKAVVMLISRRAADGSRDWNYKIQEGKQWEVEAIKAVPLQIGTATGPRCSDEGRAARLSSWQRLRWEPHIR